MSKSIDDDPRVIRMRMERHRSEGAKAFREDHPPMLIPSSEKINLFPAVITSPRLNVYREVERRRLQQDAQHGGADHDDSHSPEQWIGLIDYHNNKSMPMTNADNIAIAEYRDAMLDVAALAVAAIETLDRLHLTLASTSGVVESATNKR